MRASVILESSPQSHFEPAGVGRINDPAEFAAFFFGLAGRRLSDVDRMPSICYMVLS
jgi:hypothetical protein